MERLSIGIFVFFAITSSVLGSGGFGVTFGEPKSKCETGEKAAKEAAKVVGDLAIKLYQQVGKPEENIIFSPASIAVALALLENGAVGTTKDEIEALIGSKGSKDSTALYQSLQRSALGSWHGLFYSNLLRLKPEYLAVSKDCFEADGRPEPFKTNPELARSHINRWANKKTPNDQLFIKGSIDQNTSIVLAGVPYMQASWGKKMGVIRSSFYQSGKNNPQMVNFMTHQDNYGYYAGENFEVLELPFSDSELQLYVILPKQRDGLAAVEKSLTGDQVIGLADKVKRQLVSFKLPNFILQQSIDLAAVLAKLGVKQVFTDQADLSGITADKAKISRAIHAAYLNLNEDGAGAKQPSIVWETEPAHGTTVTTPKTTEPAVSFVADHPFIHAFVHKPTGAIVFMGRVNSVDKQE